MTTYLPIYTVDNSQNKWFIYKSNNNTNYFEYIPSSSSNSYTTPNVNDISKQGTLSLFLRPSITNVSSLQVASNYINGGQFSITGPANSLTGSQDDVYELVGNQNITDTNQGSNNIGTSIPNTNTFYYYNSTGLISSSSGSYYKLSFLQNSQVINRFLFTTLPTNFSQFNDPSFDLGTASLNTTYTTTISSSDANNTTYYVYKSLQNDISIAGQNTITGSKVDNKISITYNNESYDLISLQDFYYIVVSCNIGTCTNLPTVATTKLCRTVYYTTSKAIKDYLKTQSPLPNTGSTIVVPFSLEDTNTFLPVAPKVNVSVTLNYNSPILNNDINTLAFSITLPNSANAITPVYPSTSPSTDFVYNIEKSATAVGVAKFRKNVDILIPGFNTLFDNNLVTTLRTTSTLPIIIRNTDGIYPSLQSVWDTITVSQQPEYGSVGLITLNYPYNSKFITATKSNKNVVYNWSIVQDSNSISTTRILIDDPVDSVKNYIVLTASNISTAIGNDNWTGNNHKNILGLSYVAPQFISGPFSVPASLVLSLDTISDNGLSSFIVVNLSGLDLDFTGTASFYYKYTSLTPTPSLPSTVSNVSDISTLVTGKKAKFVLESVCTNNNAVTSIWAVGKSSI